MSRDPWKPVAVDNVYNLQDKNHYDDVDNALPASDLATGKETDTAMFYQLSVLPASAYRVETTENGNKKIVILEDAEQNEATIEKKRKRQNGHVEKSKKSDQLKKGNAKSVQSSGKRQDRLDQEEILDKVQEPCEVGSRKKSKAKKKKSKRDKGDAPKTEHKEKIDALPSNGKTAVLPVNDHQSTEADCGSIISESELQSMQNAWLGATGGVTLHPDICRVLVIRNFWTPTPIQAATLPAAILGRRNVVGAAPTGSGKTLAFGLPIIQSLFETPNPNVLHALILVPTRELALQIRNELQAFVPKKTVGMIVGGLAHVKQGRVLNVEKPPIIVGTPGRLWELMESRDHAHLNNLSQLRYLVIDEADRMIEQGDFPQLRSILDAVQVANPMDDSDDEHAEDSNEEEGVDRLLSLPGVPGEAKLTMLTDDILKQIRKASGDDTGSEPSVKEIDDEEYDELIKEAQKDAVDEDEDEISLPALPPVHRQTFVYSATLTLANSKPIQKGKTGEVDMDTALAEILQKARAKGKTKIVDLTLGKRGKSNTSREHIRTQETEFRLPPGLKLQEIECTQRHKDSHLYAYLMTTEEGASGPSLVFCNSVAGVRRVGSLLQMLGMQVRMLHAQMQQRSRLRVIDTLRSSKERTVVVCTDVAARGLDLPNVTSIVHYDAARTIDAFVHRSGRTARGIGERAVGCSLSLVSPNEDKVHSEIVKALGVSFDSVPMDGRLLRESQERVNLATKVVEVNELEGKVARKNKWFKQKAEEAGLELDDDLLDDGLEAGDKRDRSKLREAQKAKDRLRELLSQPMKTQRFGKFMSTNSALQQKVVVEPTIPAILTSRSKKRRRRR